MVEKWLITFRAGSAVGDTVAGSVVQAHPSIE